MVFVKLRLYIKKNKIRKFFFFINKSNLKLIKDYKKKSEFMKLL